jgi:hypothetical protein
MTKKSIVITGSILALSLLLAIPALAAAVNSKIPAKTNTKSGIHSALKSKRKMISKNISFGAVSAINGSSFTLTSKKMSQVGTTSATTAPVTITVNTDAKTVFKKDKVAASLSDLAVGQMVVVNGVKDANNTIANAISVSINTHPMTWPSGAKRGTGKKTAAAAPKTQ